MLDGVEMTVDEDVENGMDDAHRAVRDQIEVGVEAVEHLLDLGQVVAMDTDDAMFEHPHRDP